MSIPFFDFSPQNTPIRAAILAAIAEVYDKQSYVLGEQVRGFEAEYSHFNRVAYTVGVANGLDALHLALKALGVQPGDEVLVPSNTYIATWLAVVHAGGVPIPIEPNLATYNLNPARLEAAITPRTKGIIPVHLYGQACEMSAIETTAAHHGLWVVEDNAQSQGATWQGRLTGSFGQVNATSFYPSKNLGALGDAGAVTTDDEQLANRVKILRNYGSQEKYLNEIIGHNSRLDELQATVLRIKLQYLYEWTQQRQQIAALYNQYLADLGDLQLPSVAEGATHVYHLYVVRTAHRDALQRYLMEYEISTLIHYPVPPHLQQAFVHIGATTGAYPIAEEIAATCLSLPIWPGMKNSQVLRIAEVIHEFFNFKV